MEGMYNRTKDANSPHYDVQITDCLNDYAKQGWQVVSVISDPDKCSKVYKGHVNILLKRRKVTSTETPGVFKFGSSNPTPGGGFTFGKT